MQSQKNERDTKSPMESPMVRVTPKMYAEKINRTLRRVQQQCKKLEKNPKATVDGHAIEKLGGRYLICLPQHVWENLIPKVSYGDYPFDYQTWLEKLRVRRRNVTAERKRVVAERLARDLENQQKYIDTWNKFCLTPLRETWEKYNKREVSAFLADFLKEISIVEIPRSKFRSQFYALRFDDIESIGQVLHLESDMDFYYHKMPAHLTISLNSLCNNFWIWRGALVYFEGQNPDGTPRNPRLCSFERLKEKDASNAKFAPIEENN